MCVIAHPIWSWHQAAMLDALAGAARGGVSVTCHHLPTLSGRWPHVSALGAWLSKPRNRGSSGRTARVSELCRAFLMVTQPQVAVQSTRLRELGEPLVNLGQRKNMSCSHGLARICTLCTPPAESLGYGKNTGIFYRKISL